ncbi:MAG: 50S ribosomal protein L6 [Planctomycetes bacterium]|nr:50S ribosomal protein L6 [Planctomycetota bacterium]
MSRIGKQPVNVPTGVTVERTTAREVVVKGPKGELRMKLRPEVDVTVDKGTVNIQQLEAIGERRERSAFHGMTRAMIANMVLGVTKGYEKKLEVVGVGWNAAAQGTKIVLNIGYNKPVTIEMPKGVQVGTPNPNNIVIFGADKQAVGHIASMIRKRRPPEPYKGKGIRYAGEVVQKKQGKSFGT